MHFIHVIYSATIGVKGKNIQSQRELWESKSGVPEVNVNGEGVVSGKESVYAKLAKAEVSNGVTIDGD